MVDVGVAVGDGRGHAVVHVVAVLDLVVAQCIHDAVVDLLANVVLNVVHDAVVDGIADNIRDVAHIAGRQSVGHGGHGRGVVGDGHRAVADGGSDVGR